eukprot:5072521-Alexandrium_andersonii.AAC.1
MCIRDRSREARSQGPGALERAGHPRRRGPRGLPARQDCSSEALRTSHPHCAVSYTHLTLPTICSV